MWPGSCVNSKAAHRWHPGIDDVPLRLARLAAPLLQCVAGPFGAASSRRLGWRGSATLVLVLLRAPLLAHDLLTWIEVRIGSTKPHRSLGTRQACAIPPAPLR